MRTHSSTIPPATWGLDQAAGLRRQCQGQWVRVLGIVSNPAAPWSGVMLELVTDALSSLGHHTLLVDGSETAGPPNSWARIDLRWAVQQRHAHYAYLAARGFLREQRSLGKPAAQLRSELADAAPQADVVVVHAPAEELCALLQGMPWSPLILADASPKSLAHALVSLQRLGTPNSGSFDLLLHTLGDPSLAYRKASRMEHTVRQMTARSLHHVIAVHGDPHQDHASRHALTGLLQQRLEVDGASATACAIHRTVHTTH